MEAQSKKRAGQGVRATQKRNSARMRDERNKIQGAKKNRQAKERSESCESIDMWKRKKEESKKREGEGEEEIFKTVKRRLSSRI